MKNIFIVLVLGTVVSTIYANTLPVEKPLKKEENVPDSEINKVPYYPNPHEEPGPYYDPNEMGIYDGPPQPPPPPPPPSYRYRSMRLHPHSYEPRAPHPVYPYFSPEMRKWNLPYQPHVERSMAYWNPRAESRYTGLGQPQSHHPYPVQAQNIPTPVPAPIAPSTTETVVVNITATPSTEATNASVQETIPITQPPKQQPEVGDEPQPRQNLENAGAVCGTGEQVTENVVAVTTAAPEIVISEITESAVPSTEVAVPSTVAPNVAAVGTTPEFRRSASIAIPEVTAPRVFNSQYAALPAIPALPALPYLQTYPGPSYGYPRIRTPPIYPRIHDSVYRGYYDY